MWNDEIRSTHLTINKEFSRKPFSRTQLFVVKIPRYRCVMYVGTDKQLFKKTYKYKLI